MKATVAMEPNEIFRFAVAVGLAPLVFALARKLRVTAARWPFFIMYSAVATGYLMTVMEEVFAPEVFNVFQHAFSAVGAIAFVVAARAFHQEVTRSRGGAA
jgi:hypothetical protein